MSQGHLGATPLKFAFDYVEFIDRSYRWILSVHTHTIQTPSLLGHESWSILCCVFKSICDFISLCSDMRRHSTFEHSNIWIFLSEFGDLNLFLNTYIWKNNGINRFQVCVGLFLDNYIVCHVSRKTTTLIYK